MITKNRLSKTIEAALNAQLTKEAHASQIYLSYGTWSHYKTYPKIGNLLLYLSVEKRNHMSKIMEYILKRNGKVIIKAIPAPYKNPTTMDNCFSSIVQHEIENAILITELAKMSLDEEDWTTWNFMQWFIKEEVAEEEEVSAKLFDRLKIESQMALAT
jgi:ferritin